MSLPTMSGVGRLTDEVELRFAPSGAAHATIPLAFNSRKRDENGNWSDGDSFFVRGKAFKDLAENAAASLVKGTEVQVTGRLRTEKWQDKQTGENRSATVLMIDSIGPNLAYATARVAKVERGQRAADGSQHRQGGPVQQGGQGGYDDPWGGQQPAAGGPAADDEPPF